jgi:hypothetical protein
VNKWGPMKGDIIPVLEVSFICSLIILLENCRGIPVCSHGTTCTVSWACQFLFLTSQGWEAGSRGPEAAGSVWKGRVAVD